jgi:hypothetical protein
LTQITLAPLCCGGCILAFVLSSSSGASPSSIRSLSPADWIYVVTHGRPIRPRDSAPENANQETMPSSATRVDDYYNQSDGWWADDYLAGKRATSSVDYLGLDFYPVSWVYRLLPFPVANGLSTRGCCLSPACPCTLLLWQLKLPWLARVWGGTLFMLNGHFIVWLGAWPLPGILGLVPLMIFGFERHRETRQHLYLLIPAVCFAMQIYMAYIPGWVVTGGVLGIYGLVRVAPLLWRREVRGHKAGDRTRR